MDQIYRLIRFVEGRETPDDKAWLRRCLANYIGSRTLAALKTYIYIRKEVGCTVLHRALNALQGAFYISLVERRQKDERFVYGWFANRVS